MKDKIVKIKQNITKINDYLNSHWLVFFNTVLFLFLFKLTKNIIHYVQTEDYYNIHNEIFVISLICFITIFFVRASVLWFLIPFLIVRTIDFHEIFSNFQDYFFNKSIFAHLFENLGSKDINVIIISFFIIYIIGILIFLVGYKIIKKKWHLKASFVFITLFVYLITTLLFHYFLIEKNYRHIINNELSHMENTAKAQENVFLIVCENQNYICGINETQIKEKIDNEEFNNFVGKSKNIYKIKGNFSFGDIENIYLVVKNANKWVVNPELAKKSFHDAGNYLMICLDIAHTCWLFFFIWLNMFHFKKKLIRS